MVVPSAQNPAKAGRMPRPVACATPSLEMAVRHAGASALDLQVQMLGTNVSAASNIVCWEARVASPQGDKPTVKCFRAANDSRRKIWERIFLTGTVASDLSFMSYVRSDAWQLRWSLPFCNEQRRRERTHVEIVSRKRGDILAAIAFRKNFKPRGISSALFAWLASLPMCTGVNFSEC